MHAGRTEPAGHPPCSVGQPGGDGYGVNSSLSYYYQFYRLGTGEFHRKAEPVGCVTQSQRGPIRINTGYRTLLNFKSKKKPTPGRTEPAGHSDTGQAPHSVGQPGGDSISYIDCVIHSNQ